MSELSGRRASKKPSAGTKWEIFLQVTAGEITQADAARKWAVDVSGAPGRPAKERDWQLEAVDEAVAAGFDHTWACSLWRVSDDRVHRWRARHRQHGTLVDRAPGGNPVHGLLPAEVAAILAVAEAWGMVDRSHRKLAHRGSYEHRKLAHRGSYDRLVWVSPSTFRRATFRRVLEGPQRG